MSWDWFLICIAIQAVVLFSCSAYCYYLYRMINGRRSLAMLIFALAFFCQALNRLPIFFMEINLKMPLIVLQTVVTMIAAALFFLAVSLTARAISRHLKRYEGVEDLRHMFGEIFK